MEYLSLGKIIGNFGKEGVLKIYSTTNMGNKRYKTGATIFMFNPENETREEYKVLNYRHQGLFDFIKLEGIDTPEDALSKKGQEIHVIKNNKDLDKNTYFFSDLKGCKIIDKNKNYLGIVKEIEEFPAQLTLRVKREGKPDFFVPFIEQFIINVNIKSKEIVINVLKGLL